jgi:hypothetical protein
MHKAKAAEHRQAQRRRHKSRDRSRRGNGHYYKSPHQSTHQRSQKSFNRHRKRLQDQGLIESARYGPGKGPRETKKIDIMNMRKSAQNVNERVDAVFHKREQNEQLNSIRVAQKHKYLKMMHERSRDWVAAQFDTTMMLMSEIKTNKYLNEKRRLFKKHLATTAKKVPQFIKQQDERKGFHINHIKQIEAKKELKVNQLNKQHIQMRKLALQNKINRNLKQKYMYPPHNVVTLPSFSPTSSTASIVSWEKKVGDFVNYGDILCHVKSGSKIEAVEANERGFLANQLVPQRQRQHNVNNFNFNNNPLGSINNGQYAPDSHNKQNGGVSVGNSDPSTVQIGKPLAIIVNHQQDVSKFEKFKLYRQPQQFQQYTNNPNNNTNGHFNNQQVMNHFDNDSHLFDNFPHASVFYENLSKIRDKMPTFLSKMEKVQKPHTTPLLHASQHLSGPFQAKSVSRSSNNQPINQQKGRKAQNVSTKQNQLHQQQSSQQLPVFNNNQNAFSPFNQPIINLTPFQLRNVNNQQNSPSFHPQRDILNNTYTKSHQITINHNSNSANNNNDNNDNNKNDHEKTKTGSKVPKPIRFFSTFMQPQSFTSIRTILNTKTQQVRPNITTSASTTGAILSKLPLTTSQITTPAQPTPNQADGVPAINTNSINTQQHPFHTSLDNFKTTSHIHSNDKTNSTSDPISLQSQQSANNQQKTNFALNAPTALSQFNFTSKARQVGQNVVESVNNTVKLQKLQSMQLVDSYLDSLMPQSTRLLGY